MSHDASLPAATEGARADTGIVAIIALFDELADVIGAENVQLRQGMPASISGAIARKAQLASELERCMQAINSRQITISAAAPDLRQALADRGMQLQLAMNENTTRLRAAMASTRRRVEAVMRATREQCERKTGYGANGRTRMQNGLVGPGGRIV